MDGFKDFDNNFWHIFSGELDLVERECIRIGAIFGLKYEDMCEVEKDAVALANDEAQYAKNIFNDLTNFIGECKMRALVYKIAEVKGLDESDFSTDVSGLGVKVYYKDKQL